MYPPSAALQPAFVDLNLAALLPSDDNRVETTCCPCTRRGSPVASAVMGYGRQRCHLCFTEHKHDADTLLKLS